MNNKGFTLLEVLVTGMIACGIVWGVQMMLINTAKQTRLLEQRLAALNKAQPKKYTVVYMDDGKCHALTTAYSARWYNSSTIEVFTDTKCTKSVGTVGALNNDSFFDDVTSTTWIVSCNPGRLRVLVTNLK